MDFIRRQRASPSHNPNTVHCLCGADADLIMLGLATHEPNFNIIREEFVPNQQKPCDLCGQYGHDLNDCKGCFICFLLISILARDSNESLPVVSVLFLFRSILKKKTVIFNVPGWRATTIQSVNHLHYKRKQVSYLFACLYFVNISNVNCTYLILPYLLI